MRNRSGFTLIEMSIVLIIVGFVAGGMLVGRDLIEAATIRRQVSQLERFDAAALTFRNKYNGLPGDLPSPQAASLGFVTRSGIKGDGDGDGLVSYLGTSTMPRISGETLMFWADLSSANLIDGPFNAYSPMTQFTNIAKADLPRYLPTTPIGTASYLTVYDLGDWGTAPQRQNNYQILSPTAAGNIAVLSGGITGGASSCTPLQAQALDQKADDALPATGRIQVSISSATGGQLNYTLTRALNSGIGPPWTDCANIATTPPLYNTADSTQARQILCSLRIRAGF